jgi:multidrug efflux pump subunit AcrB
MHPSHIAIRNSASIFVLVLMIAVIGFRSYEALPREASPDIQVPILIVAIPFPGASPEDVESLITYKAENEFQNLDNLERMDSTSAEGVSTITLEFDADYDISEARTKVREKLDSIKPELPDDAEEPVINEVNLSEQPMMLVNLSSNIEMLRLTEIADELKERIEAIPGILEVRRVGGLEREIRVYVNPEKLQYHNLDLNQVSRAISAENTNIPGGSIEMGPTKYLVRVPGEFETPMAINDALVAVTNNQVPVRVEDLGRVVFGFKEITSQSRLDGTESVSLSVIKRSGENLLLIRQQVQELIAQFEIEQGGQIRFGILADTGKRVNQMVSDLENNIITGFLFVFLVLLVVMGVRNAMFVAISIPLSFLMSMVIMKALGYTLNIVVLFSLILALGMLVDNAIVVVENIYRHMQSGKSRFEAALIGIKEVAGPITSSTLTTLAAFAPIIFMPGIIGEFMTFLPQTLIITLASSLFIGLFVNPVLCSTMMHAKSDENSDGNELGVIERYAFLRKYRDFMGLVLKQRFLALLAAIAVFAGIVFVYATVTAPRQGMEFFPQTEPEEAVINIRAPVGTALEVSDTYVREIERVVEPYGGSLEAVVANVGQRRGFGAGDAGGSTTNLSHVVVSFPDWQHWEQIPSDVISDIRDSLQTFTGAEVEVTKQQQGPPAGKPVNIEVRGEDLQEMQQVAADIQQLIRDTPGLVDLSDDFDRSRPEVRVQIDRDKAARLGLRAQEIASTVRTAFNGSKVSSFRDGQDEYDIYVQLDESFRSTDRDLESLYIYTPAGRLVPLSEIASVTTGPALGSIRHVERERVITVSGNARDIPGPVLLAQVQQALQDYDLPAGVELRYTGENEDREESQAFLSSAFGIAIFLIFLVLVTQFNSVVLPFIIMLAVLLSLAGVFVGLIVHDRPFSLIMTGIGGISLAGIVVNNAIVLIDFIEQLKRQGFSTRDAIVTAGAVRLRPVLLTAVTTILGLIPMASGMDINFFRWPNPVVFGVPSGEFWKPMALSVIYGLGVATLLTLIVVPVLYSLQDSAKNFFRDLFRKKGTTSEESDEFDIAKLREAA